MPEIPDLSDPRYRDEIGFFIGYERDNWAPGTYEQGRLDYSRSLLREVLEFCGVDEAWVRDKSVASIGCGCTGDLLAWPAAVKIGVDPLLYAYQKLDMLGEDLPGTAPTIALSVSAEDIPLLDACVDLATCRNMLDHVPDPPAVVDEVSRILKPGGVVFVAVDVGGEPTPDEPSVFEDRESVVELLETRFDIERIERAGRSHSHRRDYSLRIAARSKPRPDDRIDRETISREYEKGWYTEPARSDDGGGGPAA